MSPSEAARPENATLGLVVHPSKPVVESVQRLTAWTGAHGNILIARDKDRERVGPGVATVPDEQFVASVDAVVSLGGDGTMLRAMRLVAQRPVPVLGVNYGNVGFLVELDPADLDSALPRLVNGDFHIESHLGLRMTIDAADGSPRPPQVAFNDVVLTRRGIHGAASVDLGVNDEQYGYYRCDALVVTTPTGSTAYNYSAGGPVVSPSAPAVVITAVAPMAGINRSVVLGPKDEIILRVTADSEPIAVDLDGVPTGSVRANGRVILRSVRDAAQVVRLDSVRYGRRRRVRRGLLDLPLRPDQLAELVPAELRRRTVRSLGSTPTPPG